jgi:hypothetical protein
MMHRTDMQMSKFKIMCRSQHQKLRSKDEAGIEAVTMSQQFFSPPNLSQETSRDGSTFQSHMVTRRQSNLQPEESNQDLQVKDPQAKISSGSLIQLHDLRRGSALDDLTGETHLQIVTDDESLNGSQRSSPN